MRKIILFVMSLVAVTVFYGCQQKDPNECRIHGTVVGSQYEGKRVFLVPIKGPVTAETVDSVFIKDGKFEFGFKPDTLKLYKILLDYHFRYGTQSLLVAGESGDIEVVIDSISHGGGTPLNDSLEKWRLVTEQHNHIFGPLNQRIYQANLSGHQKEADSLKAISDSVHLEYKRFTRQMAENLQSGALHDFLKGLFPLTYNRKMPDGSVVTMDADTNEPISE